MSVFKPLYFNTVSLIVYLKWFMGNINAVGNTKIADWFPIFRPLFHIVPSKTREQLRYLNKLESGLWVDMWKAVEDKIEKGMVYPCKKTSSVPSFITHITL